MEGEMCTSEKLSITMISMAGFLSLALLLASCVTRHGDPQAAKAGKDKQQETEEAAELLTPAM